MLNPPKYHHILTNHFKRYPKWQAEDIYKLIHQATLGSEHAVLDNNHARKWLEAECVTLGPGPNEPLLEPISSDGEIYRVHLRPFTQAGLELELLLTAFINTANLKIGSPILLKQNLDLALQYLKENQNPTKPELFHKLCLQQRENGFSPIHHSKIFAKTYKPAYRVIARQFLSQQWLDSTATQS